MLFVLKLCIVNEAKLLIRIFNINQLSGIFKSLLIEFLL